jgi:hypothetical protein
LLTFFILSCKSISWFLTSLSITSTNLNFQLFQICSPNFLAKFSISTNIILFIFHFFAINTISYAYANTFNCSLPNVMPLGTIFIFFITFCNAKLNINGDRGSPCFNPILFSKKDECSFYSKSTSCFCRHVLLIFINFLGILNSSVHCLSMSLVMCVLKIDR